MAEKLDPYGLQEGFHGAAEAIKENFIRHSVEQGHRSHAVAVGRPVSPSDPQKVSSLQREANASRDALIARLGKETPTTYRIPQLADFTRKGTDSRLMYQIDKVNQYQAVSAFTRPSSADHVRDFRSATQLQIEQDSSGRIVLSTAAGLPYERYSYDPQRLLMATLADSRHGDNEFAIEPYLHTNDKDQIVDKTLLVLTVSQADQLRRTMRDLALTLL